MKFHSLLSGLKKKVNAAGCEEIKDWVQGIVNNVYWVAASTLDGIGDLMLAKFSSMVNHAMNVHHHDSELFPQCVHGVCTS